MKNLWNKIKLWWYAGSIAMIKDFEEKFPDKCFLCSVARFGYREYGEWQEPDPHDCKEGNSTTKERV